MSLRLALILIFLVPSAPAQTLDVLWEKVAREHPTIVGAKAQVEMAKARRHQADGIFYPRIGLQADYASARNESLGINDTETTTLSDVLLRINLFNGFSDMARRDSATKEIDVSKELLTDSIETLALQLSEAYVNVVTLERQVENAQALVEDLTLLLETVRSSVRIGRNPESDLIQATTKMLQARSNLSDAKGKLAGGRARLSAIAGDVVGEVKEPRFDEQLFSAALPQLVTSARRHNPQWIAAQLRVHQASDEVRAAKGDLYPKVNFEGRKNLERDGPSALVSGLERETSVQLTYEYSLGRTPYHRVNEARARQLAAAATVREIETDLQGQIGEARETLLEYIAIAQLLEDRRRAAAGVFDAYRWQFNAGRRSLLDLITVREDQYFSVESVIGNQRNRLLGAARLHRLLGQLRVQMSNTPVGPP